MIAIYLLAMIGAPATAAPPTPTLARAASPSANEPVPGPQRPTEGDGRSARAKANLASYLSDADYPPDAIRAGQQGTVRFRLTVTPQGTVGGCEIVESSGSTSLDAATCRIMTTRPLFEPAHDAQGRAVADTVESRIRWILPDRDMPMPAVRAKSEAQLGSYVRAEDYPAEAIQAGAEGLAIFVLGVGPDGKVAGCLVPPRTISPLLAEATCRIMTERARFAPARDEKGSPVTDLVPGAIHWRLPASSK